MGKIAVLQIPLVYNLLVCVVGYGSNHHFNLKDFTVEDIYSSALAKPDTVSPAENQLENWSRNSSIYGEPTRATTLHGIPVPSLTATQAIGTRGHALLQDFNLVEKLAHFNRERIPERVVHAKGAGAGGYFIVTHDISRYTKAKFLNGIGKKTPIFVRFSTTGGERGTPDTAVDPHGFALKFYTEDGNYDLVGNNLEPFPIRDPMLFPDLSRSRKRNPVTNLADQNSWWDFVSLRPETTLHMLHLFSDNGRPDGYRRTNGFGVHAFKLVNAKGHVVFGKFLWKSDQPGPALNHTEAAELLGTNPEYKTQDLYDAIARGDYPTWTFYVQIMTIEQAKKYRKNPFDITRTWREEEFPHIPVGKLVLNRNPSNFFFEVEQSGFSVSNMVPGIEPSPDRVLAGRIFAYADAIIYRLGANWAQLPVNRPLAQVDTYARDGQACFDNPGGHPNYFPNSFGGSVPDTDGAGQVNFKVEGVVDRYDNPEDEYEDSRLFIERDVDPKERRRLVEAVADRLRRARREIRERVLQNNLYPVSKELGDEVKDAVLRALERQSAQQRNIGRPKTG